MPRDGGPPRGPLPALREVSGLVTYDPATGLFAWRSCRRRGVIAGRAAGHVDSVGYVRIKLNQRLYPAHRLAWLLTYGVDPDSQIDHVNGNRSDNRIENLRLASQRQNMFNIQHRIGPSGFVGVAQLPSGRWRAKINTEQGQKTIGTFDTAEAAARARDDAARRFRQEFARLNFPC